MQMNRNEESIGIPLVGYRSLVRAFALVDLADVWVAQYRWSLSGTGSLGAGNGYARRAWTREDGTTATTSLHREILGLEPGDPREGDHIDGDRLDCRRANLRIATGAQNRQNVPKRPGTSSRFKGVYRNRALEKWIANGHLNGKTIYLGVFVHEEEAAAAAEAHRREHQPYSVASRATVRPAEYPVAPPPEAVE